MRAQRCMIKKYGETSGVLLIQNIISQSRNSRQFGSFYANSKLQKQQIIKNLIILSLFDQSLYASKNTMVSISNNFNQIQEQQYLRQLKEHHDLKGWAEISQALSLKFPQKKCSGKQCRQRYINHAKFFTEPSEIFWTPQQLNSLFELISQIGCKWKAIGEILTNKPENQIKNKFYGNIRKMIRSMNHVGKSRIKKFTKPIKYEAITRIFEAAEKTWQLYPSIKNQSEELKAHILKIISVNSQEISEEEWLLLINKVHSFNLSTRSYTLKKPKKFDEKRQKLCINKQNISSDQLKNNSDNGLEEQIQIKTGKTQPSQEKSKIKDTKQIKQEINQFLMDESQISESISRSSNGHCHSDLDRQICEIKGQKFIPEHDDLMFLL